MTPSSSVSKRVCFPIRPRVTTTRTNPPTAIEVLSDPARRRQFDSVDEGANRDPPSKKSKGNFFKLWSVVFDSEARFSKNQPVPKFGDENSSEQAVEEFYNFWYNFDSWRTFEYLDEDVPDDGESRNQKRFVEHKNKASRAKRKTEDTARLRKLVDDCQGLDTRIKAFKDAKKKQRNAKRDAREAEEKRIAEEARIKAEEEKKRKEEEEIAAKASKESSKKAKDAAKNAVKKNKRVLKLAVKDVNYFVSGAASPDVIDKVLSDVELIISKIDSEDLGVFAKKLEADKSAGAVKAAYVAQAYEMASKGLIKAEEFRFLTPA